MPPIMTSPLSRGPTWIASTRRVYLAAPTDAEFLVDPQRAETVYALTKARGRKNEGARENRGESRELMRLSDELVEMARRVAALTRDNDGGQVRSDPLSYRGPPPGSATPLGEDVPPPISSGQLREMIRLRRMREGLFESDLFADPAWDMLLDLMASRLEDKPVSVSSLCIALGGARDHRAALDQADDRPRAARAKCRHRRRKAYLHRAERRHRESSPPVARRDAARHCADGVGWSALWWALTGSNRRPSRCKRDALPTELSALWPGSTHRRP